MAYIIGDDPSHGIVAASKPASTPKPSYWRTLPIGPNYRYRTSPQIPDEEDALGRKAYVDHVYNGLVSNSPEVQKVIADQYDYNKKRVLSGKDALQIADVRWNPNAHDDATNEALAQWYQKQTSTTTAADRLNFLRQYREEQTAQNSLKNAAYQPPQSSDVPTTSASGLLPLSGGGNVALAGQAVPQQTGDTAGRYTLKPVAGVSRMQSGSPEQAQQTAVPPSTNIVPWDKLQNISDSDLDNPDIVLYILNERDKNTEASFPSWAYTAAKRIIQLFDPAWTPERQIADMTPEQRKQEALNYLNKIRASVNSPGYKFKEAIPDNVNQPIEAFGTGLMNTLSWGMLDNQYFREAGEKSPAARFLGETLGTFVPAAKVGKDLASQDFGAAENPEKLAQDEAWARQVGTAGDVAGNRGGRYTNGGNTGLPGGENQRKFSEMSPDEAQNMAKEYAKKSPIEIPENAKMRPVSKADYDHISYKWTDSTYKYEVRWHTRTPEAPPEQGNTWVIERIIPGSGGTNPRSFIKIGNTGSEADWIEKWKWYDAIKARKAGVATPEQIRILDLGHWKE